MHIRPLSDRIALKRRDAETMTPSGLHLPDQAQGQSQEAEVVAVGPGLPLDSGGVREPSVAVGDVVLIGKWAGHEVEVDGVKLLIVPESDVLAVVEEG